jgi:anti-sigma factor RsiW
VNAQDTPGSSSPGAPDRFDPVAEAPLLSAYVDGELDADQTARVERHLAEHPESRAEVARLRRLKEVTAAMVLKEPPPEEWEMFWNNVLNRVERSLGWFIFLLGAVVLAGYGVYRWMMSLFETPGLPWWVKGGIFAVCLGVLLLLVSLVRERIFVRRRTRYKNVIR